MNFVVVAIKAKQSQDPDDNTISHIVVMAPLLFTSLLSYSCYFSIFVCSWGPGFAVPSIPVHAVFHTIWKPRVKYLTVDGIIYRERKKYIYSSL